MKQSTAILTLVLGLIWTPGWAAPAQPDLVPSLKSLESGVVRVKNKGTAKSGPTWLTLVCLADCPEAPGMALYVNALFPDAAAIKVPTLAPGQTFSHKLTFWKDLVFTPGTYTFLAEADAGADVAEANEANNLAVHVKTVAGFQASRKVWMAPTPPPSLPAGCHLRSPARGRIGLCPGNDPWYAWRMKQRRDGGTARKIRLTGS